MSDGVRWPFLIQRGHKSTWIFRKQTTSLQQEIGFIKMKAWMTNIKVVAGPVKINKVTCDEKGSQVESYFLLEAKPMKETEIDKE